MYNDLEHDFVTLDLPNIVFAYKKGEPQPAVTLHPFLKPLLHKLAKARPKWRLIGTRATAREVGQPAVAVTFCVYEGNDELGTIAKSYNYGTNNDVYAIDNKRMSAKRQRGSNTMTKDTTKAFKIITKEFHGRTTEELLTEAIIAATRSVNHVSSAKRNAYQTRVNNLSEPLLAFAVEHWDEFAPFAKEQGAHPNTIDTFHEAREQYADTQEIATAHQEGTGMTVVLRGTDYIIRKGTETTILTSDQLSPHLRRCIGMLKLADKDTYIPGMGVKAGADYMFVMPEPQETKTDG